MNYGSYIRDCKSGEDDLAGFINEVALCLNESALFTNISVETSTSDDCMVVARCYFPRTSEPDAVNEELVAVWQDKLCYPEFETHECLVQKNRVELFFCTTERPDLGVTGRIVAMRG